MIEVTAIKCNWNRRIQINSVQRSITMHHAHVPTAQSVALALSIRAQTKNRTEKKHTKPTTNVATIAQSSTFYRIAESQRMRAQEVAENENK